MVTTVCTDTFQPLIHVDRVTGEKFEVAIDGRDWEGDFDEEDEPYLSEDEEEGRENFHDDGVDSFYGDQASNQV